MHNLPKRPVCGHDLERWRLKNGLKKTTAADFFGLPWTKWEKLTSPGNADVPLDDPVLAMLLMLYMENPGAAPLQQAFDMKAFYTFLGFKNVTQDREAFAMLVGRSIPSIYRLLDHDGSPGRPLLRWIEAIKRLGLSRAQSLKLMNKIATRTNTHRKTRELEKGNTEK